MVQELSKLMVERLQAYQKKMGQLPERIIVYRDGVSEVCFGYRSPYREKLTIIQGQYDLLRDKELSRIREALDKFNTKARGGKPYKPTISIIVCGKRHHSRFPGTSPDVLMRNGNTVPGVVVDKGVTDIYNFDFYLQACFPSFTYVLNIG